MQAPTEPGGLHLFHRPARDAAPGSPTSADVSGTDRTMFEMAVIEIAGNIIQHGVSEASINCTLTIEVYPTDWKHISEMTGSPP